MKTIEEKAKAYDGVLKGIRDYIKSLKNVNDGIWSARDIENSLSEIFPLLKESEDEKIRKSIYKYINVTLDDNDVEKDNWLAWLEKQSEQKQPLPTWKYKKDSIPLSRDSIILNKYGCVAKSPSGALVSDVWVLDYDELAKLPKEECESQCVQKPAEEYNITGIGSKNAQGKLGEMIKNLKPANKVEPKFHEEDWTVSKLDKEARQISEVHFDEYNSYYVVNGKCVNLEEYDRLHHLWTIQDAKNGDVLATLDYILIFKEFLKNDGGISYCHYDFGAGNPQFIWYEDKNWYFGKEAIIHPATKEQRDLLFQKMKESGYEWNAEKKELKEIEQRPAWSEEDEAHLDSILKRLEGMCKPGATYTATRCSISEDINWFKSLKERYAWKPSDEQMKVLSKLMEVSLKRN